VTLVRLPTAPIPPPVGRPVEVDGVVSELVGLLLLQDAESRVADLIAGLLVRCDSVLVVDRGSQDATVERAQRAGARVLDLAAPAGEGQALRAGMQLARELGYIGALLPGSALPAPEDIDALVLAHARAPEALIMGVGPGQAIAGTEWEEAKALAEGREASPMPTFRPPRSPGLHGQVEGWFERLVQTRYAFPWGGPRLLPLQSILRRDLRESGESVHIELLALAAHAGVPTVEVELSDSPPRETPTCRKAAARLLRRFVPLTLRAELMEKMGLGGGYAPPTSSPLGLVLAASLAVAFALGLAGCPKAVPPMAAAVECEEERPLHTWPGAGDPARAYEELQAARAALAPLFVEQGVILTDPSFEGERRLRGILARDAEERLRLRFLGPMGTTVLDYVQAEGHWHISIPSARVSEGGVVGEPPVAQTPSALSGIGPERLARLFLGLEDEELLGWKEGGCAILETRGSEGQVTRRFSYRPTDDSWEVAREEVLGMAGPELVAEFADYRPVPGSNTWAYQQELSQPQRGTRITLQTKLVRTEGVTSSLFAFPVGVQ